MLAYIRSIFDSSESTSFARWATAFTILVSCVCLFLLVLRNHALPDGSQLLALGAFATAPYAVNKTAATFRPDTHDSGTLPTVSAHAGPGRLPTDAHLILAFVLVWLGLYALLHR